MAVSFKAVHVAGDDIEAVEWLYMDLLDGYHGGSPIWLCKKLSEDPAFFVDVICLLYRDKRTCRSEHPTGNKLSKRRTLTAATMPKPLRHLLLAHGLPSLPAPGCLARPRKEGCVVGPVRQRESLCRPAPTSMDWVAGVPTN